MKKTISKIYHVNTSWWDSFTSCFVGTLLGIAVTFGVSDYISKKEHSRNERTMQVIAVGKIEQNIRQLKFHAKEMQRSDSLCSKMLSYYPDSIDYIPPMLVYNFLNDLVYSRYIAYDNSVENILRSNAETWESMSPASINVLDKALFLNECILDVLMEIKEMKLRILENMTANHYIYGVSSFKEASRMIFEKPQNAYFLSEISLRVQYVNKLLPSCDATMEQIRINMNITDKELESMKDSRYTGFKMMENGYMSF